LSKLIGTLVVTHMKNGKPDAICKKLHGCDLPTAVASQP
jgi:hypothetical protein